VGLTLRVKPQISENGTVQLQIFQEVSSVQASTSIAPTAHHQQALDRIERAGGRRRHRGAGRPAAGRVLGQPGEGAVLGDVPAVGNLFKTETRSRKKTNLMVFLRPVVVRDARRATRCRWTATT
jgi:general secretion pathway protein D